jgi:predicted enzyme related to lactoylglutathione lyase
MTSPLGYTGHFTAYIHVSDLDAGIAWYQDILGVELLYKVEEMGWCEFKTEIQGGTIGLSTEEMPKQGGGATLILGVKDANLAYKQLAEKGVKLEGEVNTIEGMVSLVTFFDPDGNKLMLAEDLS